MRLSDAGPVKREIASRVRNLVGAFRTDDATDEGGPVFDPAVAVRVLRLLEEMDHPPLGTDLAAVLHVVVQNRDQIEAAVIAWVDLIEVLVQNAEGHYTRRKMGELKAAEVRGALVYLLRKEKFSLPHLPHAFEPLVIDVIACWMIDAVVELGKDHGMLPRPDAGRPSLGEVVRVFRHRLVTALTAVTAPLAVLADRVVRALEPRTPLSPALRDALNAVAANGMIARRQDVVRDAVGVATAIGEHAGALRAGVRLVGVVVQQVEAFTELPGKEKKVYARQLILAVLKDLGYTDDNVIVNALICVAVDVVIDSTVHLFNKRGVFKSQSVSP